MKSSLPEIDCRTMFNWFLPAAISGIPIFITFLLASLSYFRITDLNEYLLRNSLIAPSFAIGLIVIVNRYKELLYNKWVQPYLRKRRWDEYSISKSFQLTGLLLSFWLIPTILFYIKFSTE